MERVVRLDKGGFLSLVSLRVERLFSLSGP